MFECSICNKKLPFDLLWGIKNQWDGHLMIERKNICKRCAFNNIGEKLLRKLMASARKRDRDETI